MRIPLLGLLVTSGCLFDSDPDNVEADLNAFHEPVIDLRETAMGLRLDVTLSPKDRHPGGDGSCPVLTSSVTATIAGATLAMYEQGGYDDYQLECTDALLALPVLPAIAGATLELRTPRSERICSLHDVYLPRGLELTDGGTWTRINGVQSMSVKFSPPLENPDDVWASLLPLPSRNTTVILESLSVNDVHTIFLPVLATQDFELALDARTPLGFDGTCTLNARPFGIAMLTIVAP